MENAQYLRVIISLVMIVVFGYQAWVARPAASNPHRRPGRFITSAALVVGAVFLVAGRLLNAPPPPWAMSLVIVAFVLGMVRDLRETRALQKQEESTRQP